MTFTPTQKQIDDWSRQSNNTTQTSSKGKAGFEPTPEQIKEWSGGKFMQPEKKIQEKRQIKDYVKEVNSGFQPLRQVMSHIVSAPQHFAENIINAPGAASNFAFGTNIGEFHFPDWLDPSKLRNFSDSPTNKALALGGDIAGDLLTGGAEFKLLQKALGMTAKTPLYAKSLLGALEGATSSSSEQPGGRGLGAVIGGILPAASGVSKSSIGQKAKEIYQEGSNRYSKLYDKIISEGNTGGASDKIRVPTILKEGSEDIDKFFKHTPTKFNSSVKRFINNPTLENAHKAQSDVGKIIRELGQMVEKGKTLSTGQHDALAAAQELRKRLRGSMHSSFIESGNPQLSEQYGQATRGFAREVAPYKSKGLESFIEDGTGARKSADKLIKSKKFSESSAAKDLPGYATRRKIEELPPWAKGIGATAGTLGALEGLRELGVPYSYYLKHILGL